MKVQRKVFRSLFLYKYRTGYFLISARNGREYLSHPRDWHGLWERQNEGTEVSDGLTSFVNLFEKYPFSRSFQNPLSDYWRRNYLLSQARSQSFF